MSLSTAVVVGAAVSRVAICAVVRSATVLRTSLSTLHLDSPFLDGGLPTSPRSGASKIGS